MEQAEKVAETLITLAEDIKKAPHEPLGLAVLKCASTLLEISGYELAKTHNGHIAAQAILQSSEAQKLFERLSGLSDEVDMPTRYDA